MKNENGIEKSAILKGQTLVNLIPNKTLTVNGGESTWRGYGDLSHPLTLTSKYFIKANIVENTINHSNGIYMLLRQLKSGGGTQYVPIINLINNGYMILTLDSDKPNIDNITFYANPNATTGIFTIKDLMIIEYQEGMENWDIPYFEGMQSVQMPVLTTTGKNLLPLGNSQVLSARGLIVTQKDGKLLINGVTTGTADYRVFNVDNNVEQMKKFNSLPMGTTITLSNNLGKENYFNVIRNGSSIYLKNTITIEDGDKGINAFIRFNTNETYDNTELYVQIEYGAVATSYEPYKSNILSTPEEVVLREVNGVRDTLNLMTGEYVQRIKEMVLNGNETYTSVTYAHNNTNLRFDLYLDDIKTTTYDGLLCDKLPVFTREMTPEGEHTKSYIAGHAHSDRLIIIIEKSKLPSEDIEGFKAWLQSNPLTIQYELKTPTIKTVDLTVTDQENQSQERMKIYPSGYINTSSLTFPPILELKGVTHNNKLNMTTTNGTNNTQLTTLDNLALDGIVCRDGTVVRDSYDVQSGLYTKRVFRFTIDEEFVEGYRNVWVVTKNDKIVQLSVPKRYTNLSNSVSGKGSNNNIPYVDANTQCCFLGSNATLYIKIFLEEMSTYDVDGLLDWIKRNGNIEVAYQMATPQIVHMQPNMNPYVSTRPYQGSIESQGNILESSFLDYTSEQSIISPKPLGDGDVLRWEQGSQCYVYENDKEYIPLTDYNQPMGTVLDLEEEDGEQFVENLDGGEIIVDVPFKEKAVYERHLVPHEDNVIYPTQDKLDPTGKIEVDYICGETWQNPNDLSDIRHVGTLREDGQYDVTIRRSGDDEIRLMEGTTHLSLDGDGLNPSEFELTFLNSGGVEVGKYGDTSHTLEDCVLDSKLGTGMVYGDTMLNIATWGEEDQSFTGAGNTNGTITSRWYKQGNNGGTVTNRSLYGAKYNPAVDSRNCSLIYRMLEMPNYKYGQEYTIFATVINLTPWDLYIYASSTGYDGNDGGVRLGTIKANSTGRIHGKFTTHESIGYRIGNSLYYPTSTSQTVEFQDLVILEGDYTSYPTAIPFFEGVGSTIVNGFTSVSKNLASFGDGSYTYEDINIKAKDGILYIDGCSNGSDVYVYWGEEGLYNEINLSSGKKYTVSLKVASGSVDCSNSTVNDYFHFSADGKALQTQLQKNNSTYVYSTNTVTQLGSGWFRMRKDVIYNNLAIQIQVEEGATATDFEPYKGITYNLPSPITLNKIGDVADTYDVVSGIETRRINPETLEVLATSQTIQHTLIPSTVEVTQEPTFILPQPLRSVPNGICDRLYWDENKGHYCIEKRIGVEVFDGVNNFNLDVTDGQLRNRFELPLNNIFYINDATLFYYTNSNIFPQLTYNEEYNEKQGLALYNNGNVYFRYSSNISNAQFKQLLIDNPVYIYYALNTSEIIDLPHLNKKLTLPTHPNTLPIGHKVEHSNANPQLGLTIPYKQLNYPSRPQNIDFRMDIADYVLTWDDVKEARQYNIILNDRVIATVKEPQWNSGEEMYGYIMVEAQNELAENLSEELYIKTVPNAPAQLTVGHNPMTDYYDFEISFIKTSAIAEYYTVQYRIDGGEWVYKTIQSDEIDPNSKVLWRFSVYEINEQIEVWATATNEIGTNDILPIATYYMSPTPQWTYRINSKELFVRWMDDSPYDTQYKLRYQYKSDGIYRYAYFEGDKQEIGKLYEALIPLADDEEVTIALCIISEKENLYTKPIKASKELDPNIKPPRNFNYHWLARGLIEFYWEDNYDVDVEYEAIVEHRLTSGSNEWITDTRIFSATDTEGTGTIYRLSYQMEDLEEIRARVRMKWAMNETEWSESLTTVFIPVEGNPPQWIRRTQTQEGLLVEWEAQEYVDSYHVYVMSNGEELQHLETMDNFIYVDLDYSNPIDIEIYEATRFSGGIQSDPTDKMCFRPTMDKHQLIHDVVTPDTLTYVIEVDTVQKGIKERQQMHDINTTPGVKTKEPMDVAIKSPFTLSYHPLQLDVHQAAAKYYGTTELNIKTLDVKSRDAVEVLTFERVTDQYGVDFTVYTPSASKYPITLEVNRVRIVCFGDSLTSGHPGFWAETGTGDPQHCYEYWLDRRLKGQYEIINKGYGSDTTDRMLARFDKDVLSNNPQYCIIQGGTNDLYWAMAESMGDQEALNMKLDVMKANIMEMVKRCWDNNIIPIVGNLIPRTGATGIYKTALYDFNAWIISWCTGQASLGRNIFYVDLFNAGKEAVPPTPIEDPTNPGAMNPIYDGDALFDEFGNIIKQGRGIHLNKEGYKIWAEAIPLSIFKTYDSGLRMYKDLHCTDEDIYDDSDKQNPFYTISIDNVRRSKTKTVVRYVKNIGKTQVLFAMYASDEYNMSIEFVGSDGEKGAYANGLLAPNMIAKVTMEINLDNRDSKANFNLHLAAREYNQN